MAKQKRVHNLAKELGVTSKAILEKCRAEGLELKNHMATLSAGLEATVREWFSEGEHETVEEKSARVDLEKVRKTAAKRKKKEQAKAPAEADQGVEQAEPSVSTAVAEPEQDHPAAAEPEPSVEAPQQDEAVVVAEAPVEQPEAPAPEAETKVEEAEEAAAVEQQEAPPGAEAPVEIPEHAPAAVEGPATEEGAPAEVTADKDDQPDEALRVAAERDETVKAEDVPEVAAEPEAEPEPEEEVSPAGPQLTTPKPAQLKGPQVIRVEAPEPETRFRPRGPRPGGPPRRPGPGRPPGPTEPEPIPERGPRRGKGAKDAAAEEGRKARAKSRVHPRRSKESIEAEERIREYRDRDLLEREERLKAAGERGGLRRRAAETGKGARPGRAARPVGKIEITVPIMLKDFCAAMGMPFNQIFPKLMAMGKMVRITDTIDEETARLLAAEFDVELEVHGGKTLMEELKEEFETSEEADEAKLEPRPPVVTFLGHVDHGKTTLLDSIRKSRLLDREAGGITQQIGAYRYQEDDVDVTFIDTPGHEAFTAMRSRGATMTDVVVLVVAADDGVMPTTREAIQHARAAEVPIVVALNKIDLPGVDLNRIYGQLAEENLTPSEWGGETDVIKTSGVTGEGISDLLEHLTTLTELLDLRSDSATQATGWVVEAEEKKGQGIVATALVIEGTLKPGTVVVCGPAYGRVRAMRDDRGKPVDQATPGTPVEISGLDTMPVAGDRFYEVADLRRAKLVAEEQQVRAREKSLAELGRPKTLEELFKERETGEVPELNVILRADTNGKLEILKAELMRVPDDQVRLRIVLDGIGAVTEGDVMLAETSGAIIIGFWVTAEDNARRMAQDSGVDIRLYRVIYEVTDEIRKALEGLLEPEKKEEYRGRLEVRQVFNIGRVGRVAGSYATDGVINRNHFVRVIRDGTIVRDGARIGSLRRVKEDVREVRAGLECGLKIEGFDDVHPGDTIEAYEIVEVARKLEQ